MKTKHPLPMAISVSLILITILSCAAPIAGQQSQPATPTPTGAVDFIGVGSNGGGIIGGSGGSVGSGGSGASSGSGGSGGSNNPGNNTLPNTNLPSTGQGAYAVKQTMTLGGEAISGAVCSLTQPFSVNFNTPKVAFVTGYVPTSASQGTWTYAYNISSAGETHNASGSYTISSPSPDGTLVLTMTGKDNVAFKGFSGPFPTHYSFKLVPSTTTPCPTTP